MNHAHNVKLRESQQKATLAAITPVIIIAAASVLCRFVARRLQKLKLGPDDYLIFVGLVFTIGCFSLSVEMVRLGSGKHLLTVPLDNITNYMKCMFAYQFLYSTSILTIKLSILSFYRRIFAYARFRLITHIVAAIVVLWWIATMLVSIFSCKPVSGFWDRGIRPACINTKAFLIGNAVPNIVTDIVILGLPMPEIWRLNTQKHQKMALSVIFLLGGFVIVASLIRLVEQLKVENPDFTWAMNGMVIWTSIEPSVGVISACLPTLRPLVTYLFGRRASPSSKDANSSGLKHHDIMKKWYANTPHWDSNKESHTVSTAYPVIRAAQIQTTSNPECDGKLLGQISVRKDIHMKSEVV